MRLIVLALLACLSVTDASARILVVAKNPIILADMIPPDQTTAIRTASMRVHYSTVVTTMDRWGGDYDIVPPGQLKTEWLRRGVTNTNTYTGAIIVTARSNTARQPGALNVDSLTLSTVDLAVDVPNVLDIPILFVGIDGDFTTTSSPACSTGAKNGSGDSWVDYQPHGITKYLSGTDLRWRGANDEVYRIRAAYAAGSYLRTLVGARRNTMANQGIQPSIGDDAAAHDCVDCDSLLAAQGATAGIDTAMAWITHYEEPDGSKPIIFCPMDHVSSRESDFGTFLSAMSMLDSLTGGDVFSSDKLPITIGIQVRGGWRRGARDLPGGISPNDSTALKAGIDSLAFLRVPFAVGVNTDSLDTYTDDKNWWNRAAPYVHYSPEQWGGVIPGDRAGRSTAASWQRPLDPFGATRTRAIYGDGTCLGADSSLWCLQRANFYKLDSAFTAGRVDHVPMAANRDWVPANMSATGMARRDSLVAFLSDAGVRSVVTDSYSRHSDPNWAKSNPFSLNLSGGGELITMGRSAGSYLRNLTTPGFNDSGSVKGVPYNHSNVARNAIGYPYLRNVSRFYRGLLYGKIQEAARWDQDMADAITTNYSAAGFDSVGAFAVTNPGIYTIHVSDLGSGNRTDSAARPSHPGWWEIKYLVNTARVANRIANRAIFSFVWPQDVHR